MHLKCKNASKTHLIVDAALDTYIHCYRLNILHSNFSTVKRTAFRSDQPSFGHVTSKSTTIHRTHIFYVSSYLSCLIISVTSLHIFHVSAYLSCPYITSLSPHILYISIYILYPHIFLWLLANQSNVKLLTVGTF